jgi:hypothetical protein
MPETAALTFAHVVNPVAAAPESELAVAQPVTFESMRRARAAAAPRARVRLLTAQFAEDRAAVPDGFEAAPDLERSVLDVGRFRHPRKLPLIADLLDRVRAAVPGADYYVYTNVDIALQPHFYTAVADWIGRGYDGIVINRRTIPAAYRSPDELPRMYAEPGAPHPGHDCFVFPAAAAQRFDLGTACIGARWVGWILLLNVAAQAQHFIEVKDAHLTFHIGDDRRWDDARFDDYGEHNRRESRAALDRLEAAGALRRLPPEGRAHVDKLLRAKAPRASLAQALRRMLGR